MHASREKQIAFNKRVPEKEDEAAAINSGLAESWQDSASRKPHLCVPKLEVE
jgi:hypothetical protein